MEDVLEYYKNGCNLQCNMITKVLRVDGDIRRAQPAIQKLIKDSGFPDDIRAIWVSGNPVTLIVGTDLTMFLTSRPTIKPHRPKKTFKQLVDQASLRTTD